MARNWSADSRFNYMTRTNGQMIPWTVSNGLSRIRSGQCMAPRTIVIHSVHKQIKSHPSLLTSVTLTSGRCREQNETMYRINQNGSDFYILRCFPSLGSCSATYFSSFQAPIDGYAPLTRVCIVVAQWLDFISCMSGLYLHVTCSQNENASSTARQRHIIAVEMYLRVCVSGQGKSGTKAGSNYAKRSKLNAKTEKSTK